MILEGVEDGVTSPAIQNRKDDDDATDSNMSEVQSKI